MGLCQVFPRLGVGDDRAVDPDEQRLLSSRLGLMIPESVAKSVSAVLIPTA